MTTAAGLILGDEILSGKVRDVNSPLLIETLRDAGVQLVRLVVLGDDLERIAAEVASCAAAFDRVITSGGVGPTHDDCTIAAVARAFSLPLEREPRLEAFVRRRWAGRLIEAALGLADVPTGSRLIGGEDAYTLQADVWRTADGTTWTRETDAAPFGPRAGHAGVLFNGAVLIAGGRYDSGIRSPFSLKEPSGFSGTGASGGM